MKYEWFMIGCKYTILQNHYVSDTVSFADGGEVDSMYYNTLNINNLPPRN